MSQLQQVNDLTLFIIDDCAIPIHKNCASETCLIQGGEICVRQELKHYLSSQRRIQNSNPHLVGDDWSLLLSHHPTAQEFLSSSKGYRLRYKRHGREGIKFIQKLLRGHQGIALNQLWGAPLEIINFASRFELLCMSAERQSTGAIYRLYDLCEGKMVEAIPFELTNLLALLFSMGHGKNCPIRAESISQLVSGYQFFKAFSTVKLKSFSKLVKTEKGENSFKAEAKKMLDIYLSSQEGYEEVIKIWGDYQRAYKSAFGSITACIKSANDDDFVQKLKATLPKAPIRPSASDKFPINFFSEIEAIYHAYKHEDVTQAYHSVQNMTPHESMFNYLEVIRYVIQNGSLSKTHPPIPDQFVAAKNYIFDMKTHKGLNVRVFVRHYSEHNTYTLSCF